MRTISLASNSAIEGTDYIAINLKYSEETGSYYLEMGRSNTNQNGAVSALSGSSKTTLSVSRNSNIGANAHTHTVSAVGGKCSVYELNATYHYIKCSVCGLCYPETHNTSGSNSECDVAGCGYKAATWTTLTYKFAEEATGFRTIAVKQEEKYTLPALGSVLSGLGHSKTYTVTGYVNAENAGTDGITQDNDGAIKLDVSTSAVTVTIE